MAKESRSSAQGFREERLREIFLHLRLQFEGLFLIWLSLEKLLASARRRHKIKDGDGNKKRQMYWAFPFPKSFIVVVIVGVLVCLRECEALMQVALGFLKGFWPLAPHGVVL
ncbi:hypothetical protein TRVL_10244 [Trypanosoma vivax]|nr:hypothetical protein TRVL_10244 [Trypanosoma vivax]